jgi:hypothetical protein
MKVLGLEQGTVDQMVYDLARHWGNRSVFSRAKRKGQLKADWWERHLANRWVFR